MKMFLLLGAISLSASLVQAESSYYSKHLLTEMNQSLKQVQISSEASPVSEEALVVGGQADITALGFGIQGTKHTKGTCELIKQRLRVTVLESGPTGTLQWIPQEIDFIAARFSFTLMTTPQVKVIPLIRVNEDGTSTFLAGSKGTDSEFNESLVRVSYSSGNDAAISDFNIHRLSPDFSTTTFIEYEYQNIPRGRIVTRLLNQIVDELDNHKFKCRFKK